MAVNSSNSGFRPSPGVFFSPDGNGGLQVNSTGMWANMALQKIAYEQELQKSQHQTRAEPETVTQAKRQRNLENGLNRFREGLRQKGIGTGDERFEVTIQGKKVPASNLSSPLPLFSLKTTPATELEKYRDRQLQLVGADSFIGQVLPKIYAKVDLGVQQSNERRAEIASRNASKKQSLFSGLKMTDSKKKEAIEQEYAYIMQPLESAMESANRIFAKNAAPMRMEFRRIWDTESTSSVQMYLIHALSDHDAGMSFHEWEGMAQACDRNGNYLLNLQQ